jgi:hypothetical protein
MNKIADQLISLLLKDGRFYVARNSPDMNVHQMANDSNAFKADIHLAIHSNAGGGVGTEVYAYGPNTNSERLAKCLYQQIAPLSPGSDRGVKYNKGLVEVGDMVNATSALVELAFHDNSTDAAWLANSAVVIAEGLYKGICDYFGYNYRALEVAPPVAPPGPSGTPIMGQETITVEQCTQYIKKVNPNAPDIVPFYKNVGGILGIRWGYAIAQAIKETGFFRYTGDVKAEQNNFAGIGATGGVTGASFSTPELGVIAHLQHLFAYACDKPLIMSVVDPRFSLVKRGSCPTWESLNGRWAVPGVGYGEDVVRIYKKMAEEVVLVDKKAQVIALLSQAQTLQKQAIELLG